MVKIERLPLPWQYMYAKWKNTRGQYSAIHTHWFGPNRDFLAQTVYKWQCYKGRTDEEKCSKIGKMYTMSFFPGKSMSMMLLLLLLLLLFLLLLLLLLLWHIAKTDASWHTKTIVWTICSRWKHDWHLAMTNNPRGKTE